MPAPQPGLRAISAQMSCSLEISRDRAALERQFAHPRATGRLDPELWGLCEASLRETAPLDAAPRHDLDVQRSLAGNRLERPWFAGKVVELGRRHGIPTPVCNLLYAALKPHMNGKPN